MENPYTNTRNGSRNLEQAALIIKLVSNYLSNSSIRAFYLLIGVSLILLVEEIWWIKLLKMQEI
jgi:hypothetical protein